ncbi:hypothetical protein BN946_scf184977.g7 [Trametes cinnabarina]|uniref:Uncharacterized protein n=1 Tax=Pycnoporus cinnabarinus TaxID=5643 RepID=A0A060SDA2_PYCCI|nr:hypothetical protein BN946_scf184977.g7 [Trametes cinnabarina]
MWNRSRFPMWGSLLLRSKLRIYLRGIASRGRDIWTQWREEEQHEAGVHALDALTLRVWLQFLEDEGAAEDVAEVLWTAYPVDSYSDRMIRVVDFLAVGDAPEDLQRHRLLYLSLMDVWQYGREQARTASGVVATLLRFVDHCGTPRVLHIADLLGHIAYLGILYHYLNWPPYLEPIRVFDTRRALLMTYTLSKLMRPWSSATAPPFLALFAFVICLPYAPAPNTFTFFLLLTTFCWEILLLHFSVLPSPLLLFRPDWILPFAVLARRSVAKLFSPTAFFVPALIACLLMLQFAMLDRPQVLFTTLHSAAPTDSLVAYFSLFTTFLLFLMCAFTYSVLVHPFLATLQGTPATRSPWDRYTEAVGLEARRTFVHAVVTYATPYYFPPPVNLAQILLVRVPQIVLQAMGKRGNGARLLTLVQRVLWRLIVGPAAVLLSGFWLWYLHPDN